MSVYDTGEEPSTDGSDVAQPYIVMEYVAGRTLRDILREGRKILPERALEITSRRAGRARLQPPRRHHPPRHQARQRDAHPERRREGDGLRHRPRDRPTRPATMTQTAAVVGTAQYLSPEQARGETVDSRSDVYSTGCLLYELLTGRPPFVGDSPVVGRLPARPRAGRRRRPTTTTDLPPEIDAIVMKSLAKRVEDRYQSAAAMRSGHRALPRRPAGARRGAARRRSSRRPTVTQPTDGRHPGAAAGRGGATRTTRHPAGPADLPGAAPAAGARARGVPAAEDVRQPQRPGQVPDLTGMTEQKARAAIGDAGLSVGNVDHAADDDRRRRTT